MDTYSYLRREGNMHMGTRVTRYLYEEVPARHACHDPQGFQEWDACFHGKR